MKNTNNRIVRVIEGSMAFGNYKGFPFDYEINKQRLTFVDSQGKWLRNQDKPVYDELMSYLVDHFSLENDKDYQEHAFNVRRANAE